MSGLSLRSASYNAFLNVSGASLLLWGQQAAWAIDPVNGDDAAFGTPSSPLKTMGELNFRLDGNLIQQATTVQCVGDVLDQPLWLSGTRIQSGASLTLSGTRTDVASGLVSVVTGLGAAGIRPWQITTTGINWTAVPAGAQVRFSTGELAMILEVVDANNVIIGAIGALTGVTSNAPTVGSTVTAATLSRALPPVLNASGVGTRGTFQVLFRDFSFDAANDYTLCGGVPTQFYGCELKAPATLGGNFIAENPANLRCSRLTCTGTGGWNLNGSMSDLNTAGVVCVGLGAGSIANPRGRIFHGDMAFNGARLSVNSNQFVSCGAMYFRRVLGVSCILVNDGGALLMNGPPVNGATGAAGNTLFGIDVPTGRVWYIGAGNKPTVTGTSGDTRIGGAVKTYAQVPFISLDATVPTAITGTFAQIIQI